MLILQQYTYVYIYPKLLRCVLFVMAVKLSFSVWILYFDISASSHAMFYEINGELWILGLKNLIARYCRRINANRFSLQSTVQLSKSARPFDAVPELNALYRPYLSSAFCRNVPVYCTSSSKRKVGSSLFAWSHSEWNFQTISTTFAVVHDT